MRLRRILSALLFVVGLAGTVEAATLFTPLLNGEDETGDRQFACRVVNVSNDTREVILEIITIGGNTIEGPTPTALPPNMGTAIVISGGTRAFCKITVKGSKSTVRGALEIEENTGNGDFFTIVAVPAQ
jgi:hypothetical protein